MCVCLCMELNTRRHRMETFSALQALSAGNSPVIGGFPSQRPVTRSFDVFFNLRLNTRLNKTSWGWWLEAPVRLLCHHCNEPSPFPSAAYDNGAAYQRAQHWSQFIHVGKSSCTESRMRSTMIYLSWQICWLRDIISHKSYRSMIWLTMS